jgi:small subunit ribosomal protein S2
MTNNMKVLLEVGAHFGHPTKKWNPKMAKFVYEIRNKIHIIDLQKALVAIQNNCKVVKDFIIEGRSVIFVGTKKQARISIKEEALRCGAYFVSERWLGGTLTNFETLKKSIIKYKEIENMKKEGIFKLLSKKEQSRVERERVRLEKSLEGLKNMSKLPGLMFVIDPVKEKTAVLEARKLNIPVLAICDTNCDPDSFDYFIPGNDDAIRSVRFFCHTIADAILEAKGIIEKKMTDELKVVEVSISATKEGETSNVN